ncbi:hypothetical protein [Pleurocapsa sp. PCC 7327]|nr:hypothetical protein [Pleurocapsa sp. PCC 7327]
MIQPSATSDREKVCSEQKPICDRYIPITKRLVTDEPTFFPLRWRENVGN